MYKTIFYGRGMYSWTICYFIDWNNMTQGPWVRVLLKEAWASKWVGDIKTGRRLVSRHVETYFVFKSLIIIFEVFLYLRKLIKPFLRGRDMFLIYWTQFKSSIIRPLVQIDQCDWTLTPWQQQISAVAKRNTKYILNFGRFV